MASDDMCSRSPGEGATPALARADTRWNWLGTDLPRRDACVTRHMLEVRAVEQPEKVFVRFENGDAWTYRDALAHSRRAAAGLAKLGLGVGDVLFVMLPNGPDFLKAWFGANFLGAAIAAPNTAMRGATLQHLVTLSDASIAVIDAKYLDRLGDLDLGKMETIIVSAAEGTRRDPFLSIEDCFDLADPADAPDVVVEPWHTQFILFTSGTTGPSKGAIVTYVQMHDMVLATAAGRLSETDVYLASTPLFHVGGTRVVLGMLMLGGSVVLLSSFKTDIFWDTVREYGATAVVLIGAVARFLDDGPAQADDADNPLRLVSMVPLVRDPPAFSRRFGVDIITSYGMSELSIPILSEVNPTNSDSCGRLRPGYEARIVDEYDREVGEGEVGELIVRADRPWTISPGYWKMPEASIAVWRNGWFHTGDRMRRNAQGEYFYVDRQKDAIRRRGENVSAFEVEAGMLSHPAIADAAAIGVASTIGEQDIMAVVVLRPGAVVEPAELLEYLRPRMAYYMVPRYFRYVADLPRTPSMRVQKHLLRAEGVTPDTWDREAAGIVVKRDA